MQAADGTNNPSPPQFNPFLVEDLTPPLLLDSPNDSESKPIEQVLSFFQKDCFQETESNVSHNLNEKEKMTIKTTVDEKFCKINESETLKENNHPPPRPPLPATTIKGENNDNNKTYPSPCPNDTYPESNNDPSSCFMYTANEGLPVESHNIGK